MKSLNVFDYLDYQLFLQDFYKVQKNKHHFFSYRYMAQKVGADSAHIARIFQGKRHISDKTIDNFCKLFGFDDKQKTYFETLVAFNKSRSDKQKRDLYRKLLSIEGVSSRALSKDEYQFYQKWYSTALRALIGLHSFYIPRDYGKIASCLSPRIPTREVKEGVELLLKLNFIKIDKHGKLCVTEKNITSGKKWISDAVRNFQGATIKLAGESLSRHAKELRDISTVTLGLSASDLPEIEEMISQFRASIIQFANKKECADDVYQLNIQLFPLSDTKADNDSRNC